MPLQQVVQALERTPAGQNEVRSVLAFTAARWCLSAGDEASAVRWLGDALQSVPGLRPAMRVLYRIYERRGDIRSAVLYLDQEIRATRHPREAAALYRERGLLVEQHFQDLPAALQCYEAALKATPKDLAVLRSVERVSLARGDVFHLIGNLEAQLEVLRDEGLVSGVLRDLALLEARHAGDVALGADMLLTALEYTPGQLGLLFDLFRLAEVAADGELMLRSLEEIAERSEGSRRAMPLARASLVLREHRERGAAVDILRAAAAAQPHNFSLWRNLEELSMATSRYDTALEATLGQLRAIGDDEDSSRAELYYRAGRLAMLRLDRVNEGLAAMRKALRLFPGHLMAVEDAARYLIAHGMWSQQLELMRLEASTGQSAGWTAAEMAQAHLRVGQILEERLGELDGARLAYEDATRAAPHYRPPRDRLERVLHQIGDHESLKQFYKRELDSTDDSSRRVFLLSVLGQLHASDRDPAHAVNYLAAVLKEIPEHMSSLQQLARLLARAGRDRDVLKVTEQEIRLTVSAVRKAKLSHRAGELALSLGENTRAREAFEKSLEFIDDHAPSLGSLERLLATEGDHEALLALLRKRLLYVTDRNRKVSLHLQIAALLGNELGRPQEALTELTNLLQRFPRHLPALHAAERLAQSLGEWATVVALLEQHIGAVQGPRTKAILLHRSAHIRSRRLNDDHAAISELVRALELWPQLGVARALLLSIYERLGMSRQLQAFAEAGLTSERGADDRRALALQLAELTPKPVVAIQYLGAVAEARPDDVVTQLRLARAAHAARRPEREALAIESAVRVLSREADPNDPELETLRFRAARAHEAAGNLDRADQTYAEILDVEPGHVLARSGRLRIKDKRKSSTTAHSDDLDAAGQKAKSQLEQAAFAQIAAEIHERRGDLPRALTSVQESLSHAPNYLPALHCKARILERLGGDEQIEAAIATLEHLAESLQDPGRASRALCQAGTVALRTTPAEEPNPRAWQLFAAALRRDNSSDLAFHGLLRTLSNHGPEGAPTLDRPLRQRLDVILTKQDLTPGEVRDLGRLAAQTAGPALAAELLERGLEGMDNDGSVRAELAQHYARLGRWTDVVAELDRALTRKQTPERAAALHYFRADALERAGDIQAAAKAYLEAGKRGYHPVHALVAADRLAKELGDQQLRVAALSLLVEIGDGKQRAKSLQALAGVYRGPLKKPDVAVDLMQELLLLEPTDVEIIGELNRLLLKLGRGDEARASLLAGLAQFRAWLRSQGLGPDADDARPVAGLLRLLDMLGEADGVYLATSILEVAAPDKVPAGRGCENLISDPWPLPATHEGRPFDHLVGDLAASGALDLLHEGTFFLPEIPEAPPAPPQLKHARPLGDTAGVVMVTRALADSLGVVAPQVFVDPDPSANEGDGQHRVRTIFRGRARALLVGRKVNSAPFTAPARNELGRALMRLAMGGDFLFRRQGAVSISDGRLLAILVALAEAGGASLDVEDHDAGYAKRVSEILPPDASGLEEAAHALAASVESLNIEIVRRSMATAQDRAGVACSADPRPVLRDMLADKTLGTRRGTALLGYMLSDDHLSLRRTLGYHAGVELDISDIEEVSG